MAAASGEVNPIPSQNDDSGKPTGEDSKDGKKRKFRPFEAMRKFFKSGKKSSKSKEDVSAVSGKSRSLQMITGHEDSDDDGGFKRLGTRSMSEDSVFQPEVKAKIDASRQTAISMESLNKNDFKSELANKLKKRYSAYSSDDEALPHSPTPPASTADIVMGIGLKPLPGTGKSTSRESDISIDISEEDDPFRTDWSKSVASVSQKKSSTQSLPDSSNMELDLSAIGKDSITLSNDAARHRISVKRNLVKRRPSGTRKNKDQKATTTGLPRVKEESPSKSDKLPSPVTNEPQSPISPVSPLSPTPPSPKVDLFPKTKEKIPEQKVSVSDDIKNVKDVPNRSEDILSADVFTKKPDEHKTVISIGQKEEKDTYSNISFGLVSKPIDVKPPLKSMSLDRRMNYNLADQAKPTDNIRQIARQRPKSLHDSVHEREKEADSELSKTFNKMKRNSFHETDSAISNDTSKDTGFYVVGSRKSKEKEIPFGARRPESKSASTSFNDGISTKQADTLPKTTQSAASNADLVKPAVSPTKPNITGYVLKKEPLKSQTSLTGDKKDISPSQTKVVIESKKDPQKESVKQTLSGSGKEAINFKGAENTKEPISNYENLNFDSGLGSKRTETKDTGKLPEKAVIISADDKKNESPSKRHSYDNVLISKNEATNKLTSPREEYKLKRQSRSRTLPEQPVSADLFANQVSPRKDSLTQSFRAKDDSLRTETILEKLETKTPDPKAETIPEQSEPKPLDPKTKELTTASSTPSIEKPQPAWMKMALKRQEETKEKEVESTKEKLTPKPVFTGARISSLSDSMKEKSTPKSVFTTGSTPDSSKEKETPKVSETTGFKGAKSSFRIASSSEPQKDVKVVNKSGLSGISSQNKDEKDTKNSDSKTAEKTPVSAASLAKSFESSIKQPTSTGRNVSIDSPKGWKSASLKPKEVKIEIIEKTDPTKSQETNKPPTGRTTTAKKTEEKAPLREKNVPDKCVDRKSVLDMVKNFQNLQVS